MSLDPGTFYRVMACAYRNGALEKIIAIQAAAMESVMSGSNLDMEDFINLANEMEEWKLQLLDRILTLFGPLFILGTFDPLMKLVSRVLDFRPVEWMTLELSKIIMKLLLIWETPSSLAEKLDSILLTGAGSASRE